MTKKQFLAAVAGELDGLSQSDIKKSLDYYSEMIDDRMEDGLSEEEAVAAMGSVKEIAHRILTEFPLAKVIKVKHRPSRGLRAWEIVLLILGSPVWLPLLAAALIVLLAVYIVIWSAIVVLYAAELSIGAVGIASILGTFLCFLADKSETALLLFGAGLLLVGLAILFFFVVIKATAGVFWLSKQILRGLKSLLIGRGK